MNLAAQAIKCFMFERSSWPPSCWRQASSPSSSPVFTGAGEVLDRLTEVAAVQFGPALPGGADQRHGKAWFEGHGYQGGLSVTRDALNPHVPGIHRRIGFQVIQAPWPPPE